MSGIYLYCFLAATYSAVLFWIERKRAGRFGKMLNSVWLMMIGLAFASAVNFTSRYFLKHDHVDLFYRLNQSWLWHIRFLPFAFATTLFAVHHTRKLQGKTDEP